MQEEEKRLSKEVDELCRRARRTDEEEDQQFGPGQRGDELPEELQHRQARLDKIRAAKEKLEADQKERDKARGRSSDDDRRWGSTPLLRTFLKRGTLCQRSVHVQTQKI